MKHVMKAVINKIRKNGRQYTLNVTIWYRVSDGKLRSITPRTKSIVVSGEEFEHNAEVLLLTKSHDIVMLTCTDSRTFKNLKIENITLKEVTMFADFAD